MSSDAAGRNNPNRVRAVIYNDNQNGQGENVNGVPYGMPNDNQPANENQPGENQPGQPGQPAQRGQPDDSNQPSRNGAIPNPDANNSQNPNLNNEN